MKKRGVIFLAAALLLPLAVQARSVMTVPLMMTTKYMPPQYSAEEEVGATLNQDGSWTIDGDLGKFMGFDPGYDCLADELRKASPQSNPTPDNSRPMSMAQMEAVMCQSPIVRACLPKLRPQFTCEPQVAGRTAR